MTRMLVADNDGGVRSFMVGAIERRELRAHKEGIARREEPTVTWTGPAMAPVVKALRKVAATSATVLLLGESGTGKEVAARAIHAWSNRASGPFVAINCAALSDMLLESELFGHEKGAFTGAVAQRRGRIELADGGTFFLDEVGELKPDLQARLLRVIQERRFERLGGDRTIGVDVRWMAATNQDLTRMVKEGTFREDLYHRLAVFPVLLPPLRERLEDIIPLAEVLLERVRVQLGRPELEMSGEFRQGLLRWRWPGNVRELANTLERAGILADGPVLRYEHLLLQNGYLAPAAPGRPQNTSAPVRMLEEVERDAIARALSLFDGNRRKAAETLGIGLRTLYNKLKQYELA